MLLSTHLIEGVERVFDAVMMVVDGRLLRSVSQTAPGRALSVMLADGRILGTVTGVEHTDAPDPARQS